MDRTKITSISSLLCKFYTRCFSYPYDEMNYELHHIFRLLEQNNISEDDYQQIEQVLSIINQYQGEDIKDIRDDYVLIFTGDENRKPLCPMLASEFLQNFGKHYDMFSFSDFIFDSGIPINPGEDVDSIINFLEYFSILLEQTSQGDLEESFLKEYIDNHIINWIPYFCDVLYKAASMSFYREIAIGLKGFLLWLSED